MATKFESAFISTWWVAACILFTFFIYENCRAPLNEEFVELRRQIDALSAKIDQEKYRQQLFQLQINSQSDPKWVEMTLIKGLGLVPEDQIKIVFEKEY